MARDIAGDIDRTGVSDFGTRVEVDAATDEDASLPYPEGGSKMFLRYGLLRRDSSMSGAGAGNGRWNAVKGPLTTALPGLTKRAGRSLGVCCLLVLAPRRGFFLVVLPVDVLLTARDRLALVGVSVSALADLLLSFPGAGEGVVISVYTTPVDVLVIPEVSTDNMFASSGSCVSKRVLRSCQQSLDWLKLLTYLAIPCECTKMFCLTWRDGIRCIQSLGLTIDVRVTRDGDRICNDRKAVIIMRRYTRRTNVRIRQWVGDNVL